MNYKEIHPFQKKLNEECGVFGIYRVENASKLTYYGLHALQHRGQEAVGIATSDGMKIKLRKGKGLLTEVIKKEDLEELDGTYGLGHVRYATSGSDIIENVQPLMIRSHQGDFAVVHNGQITNAKELRRALEEDGSIFQGTSDSEVIAHLIQKGKGSFIEKIMAALQKLEGAFAFVMMTKNTLYAMRDKNGIRPLSIAVLDNGYVISSETCAFDIINAKFVRDVNPGEVIRFGKEGVESFQYSKECSNSLCAMEYIYFSRPDSVLNGKNVHAVRKETGRRLAKRDTTPADIVVGVPDSSLSAAMGYAEERKLPYEMGLIKNKYVARTFIQPTQQERERGVKMKLSAVSSIVKGKRIILLDDSIVRGTTSKQIIRMLRDAGAKEIHLRIVSAPIKYPCFYGVDMRTQDELISFRFNESILTTLLGVESIKFLTLEEMKDIFSFGSLCHGCFTGDYITKLYSNRERLLHHQEVDHERTV